MHLSIRLAALIIVSAPIQGQACPLSYHTSGYTCSYGGSDICTLVSSNTIWECDATRNGDTQSAEITIVSNFTGEDYSAWGTDASGAPYCCEVTDTDIEKVVALGGDYNDDINFQYSTYNLDTHTSGTKMDGVANGRGSGDNITGSRTNNSDYKDSLLGGPGDDSIDGDSGRDEIRGEEGEDIITGGPQNDDLHGGPGDDTINGNDGDDMIFGGDEPDTLNGDAGNDTVHGDRGDDIVCGGADFDSLTGDLGDDQLYDTDSSSVKNCGGQTSDYTDNNGTIVQCDTTTYLTSDPGCP